MGSYGAIAAVGKSLERLFDAYFTAHPPLPGKTIKVVVVRTADFDSEAGVILLPGLSIFLHRVEANRTMRAAWASAGAERGRAILPLDLHFLISAWADNAESEQAVLGRAIECLDAQPILTGPLLVPDGAWAPSEEAFGPDEGVQVLLDDLPADMVLRMFDSLPTDYRVSVGYVARVVRVESAVPLDPRVAKVLAGDLPIGERPA